MPYSTALAGQDVVQNIAATPGVTNVLFNVNCSMSGTILSSGSITVKDGNTTIYSVDLPAVATVPFNRNFDFGGLQGTVGNSMTITLASQGIAAVGKLNTQVSTA